jgi:hypothetical protein
LGLPRHELPNRSTDARAAQSTDAPDTPVPQRRSVARQESATGLNKINEYSPSMRLPDPEGCTNVTTYRHRSIRRSSFPGIGRGWVVRTINTRKGKVLKSTPIAGFPNSRGEPTNTANLASDQQAEIRSFLGSAHEAIRSQVRRAIKSGYIYSFGLLSAFPTWHRVCFSRRTTDSHSGHVSMDRRVGLLVFNDLATATPLPL